MKRVFFLLPLAIFLGMAFYFAIGLTKDPRKLPSALLDQPVPGFDLPALKPEKPGLATGDLMGEVVIVNVFASWCVPCRAEHPLWMKLAESGEVPIHESIGKISARLRSLGCGNSAIRIAGSAMT